MGKKKQEVVYFVPSQSALLTEKEIEEKNKEKDKTNLKDN